MRKIQYIYTAITALLLIAFSACQDERFGTNDPDSPSDTPYAPRTIGDYTFADDEIRFAISVDNLNGPKTRAVIGGATDVDIVSGATVGLTSSGNVENISGYTAFETGDEIGLFVVERTDPALRAYPSRRENYAQNVKWVYYTDADPKKSGFIPAGTGEEQQKNRILYPGKNRTVDIYAYYPYTESKDMVFDDADRFVFTVAGNQRWNAVPESDRADLHKSTFMKSDLLWADSGEDGQAKGPVTLNFAHAMSLVELTITADNPHLTNIDQITEVLLLNAMPELHYGGNQAPTAGGTPLNIQMRLVSQKENIPHVLDKYITRVYRALIPAQTFNAGDELFHLSMGSSTYTYRIAKEFELKAGKMNKYSVILNDRDPNELFYNRKDKDPKGFNLKLNENQDGKNIDLLIAAPWVEDKGVCYTYIYDGINWTKTGDLRALIPDDDCFSFGASLDAGRLDAIVGAPQNNNKRGRVYRFTSNDGKWSYQNKRTGENENDELGTSVAIGSGTVVKLFASAPGIWNSPNWLMVEKISSISTLWESAINESAKNSQSTKKVLAHEDYLVTQHSNNITIYNIALDMFIPTVTTITDPIVALNSAFLFCRSTNAIKVIDPEDPIDTPSEELSNPNKNINDEFGLSANITGGTKLAYAIIGAPGTDNDKGAVHIWKCNRFTWSYLGKIQPSSLKEGTRFGTSVAIIETKNINEVNVAVAVSGMNNVYVFNNTTEFFTTTP